MGVRCALEDALVPRVCAAPNPAHYDLGANAVNVRYLNCL